MEKFHYIIKDELGIHARPAGLLVKEAGKYQSVIKIRKGEKEADAKRIFGIMGLACKCTDKIEVTAEGPDEKEAIQGMEAFFKEQL